MQESVFEISNNLSYYIVEASSEANIDTAILSESEFQKYKRFRRKEDALAFFYGRQLLHRYLQKHHSTDLHQIQIGEYGKPFIIGNPFYFNISHSNPYVAVVFSNANEVGIDIEEVPKQTKQELLKMAEIVFSKAEIAKLEQFHENAAKEYFTRLWVLKESYIKLKGKGFYINTKEIIFQNIESSNPNLTSSSDMEISFEIRKWQNNFYLCVAYYRQ